MGATRLPAASRDADDQVGTKDAMKRKAEETAAIHNARRRLTRQQKKILQLEEAAEQTKNAAQRAKDAVQATKSHPDAEDSGQPSSKASFKVSFSFLD